MKRAALALLLGARLAVAMADSPPLEAQVKAAYVFHLLKYVEWAVPPSGGIHLCVTGSDGVTALLGELAGKQVREQPVVVEAPNANLSNCQVLFVGRSERRWAELAPAAQARGVLTVGNLDGFTGAGGIVGFYLDGGRVRLEVNTGAAQRTNLRISSRLLEVARSVR